ncbi:MAG: hypothetical protein ABJB12_18965 [Pseudomonadota bacterium]
MKASGSLAGLLVVGWASAVAAQPSARFALSWSAPPGCPTAENVQARVDALLGGGTGASSVADVRASGQVERVDSGFRLLLSMGVGSTPSSRVIEARTCDALAGAAAIAIALLARSTAETSASTTGSDSAASASADGHPSGSPAGASDAPEDAAAHEKEAPAATPPAVKPAAEAPPGTLHFVIDAPIGAVGWGALPGTGFGLGAALGIRWKALRTTVGAQLWQPQTDRVSGFATRFTLQTARAEGCLLQAEHGFELGPCIGAGAQRLVGEGAGSELVSAKSRTAVWVSGTAGLFLSAPMPSFSHLRFFGEANVVVSPQRPRFTIEQLGLVHAPAIAAPELNLGCEWIF